ncbi:hypothetical protein ACVWZD_000448 [Streptomyces sp. TE3672]
MFADLSHRENHTPSADELDKPQSPGPPHGLADSEPSASRGTPLVFSVLSGLAAVGTIVLAATLPRR